MGAVGSIFSALFRKESVVREEFDDLEFVEDSEDSSEEEEEIIRKEIRNLFRKLRKRKVKKKKTYTQLPWPHQLIMVKVVGLS